jgi:hypothetical protein
MARKAAAAKANKKTSKISVDFTGVETRILLPEGIYNAKVASVEMEPNDGKPYLKWTFRTIDDDPKLNDKPLYNNTSLQPQSLWVLGSLLETLGVDRPDGAMDLDLDELVDLELGLVVEHEEYQGKQRAKVVDFTPAGSSDDDGDVTVDDDNDTGNSETYTEEQVLEMDEGELDELVEELGLKVKKSKKLPVYAAAVVTALEGAGLIGEADEGGDGYTEDEINEMDADELKAVIKEHELDVKPLAKIAKFRAAVIEALEAEDLIKEADGDDEKYSEDDVNGMDADELGALVKKHELDVKPLAKLSKYRAAVIDALEAEDLISDED